MRYGAKLKVLALMIIFAPGLGFAGDGPPSVSVLPAGYDFGTLTLEVGSATRIFAVSNKGGAELVITGVAMPDPGNYSLDLKAGAQPCGKNAVLSPGETCTFAVLFRPKKEGPLNMTITIISNDPAVHRLEVPLAGFGGICHC
jgi:hypothetical protein